MISLIVPVLNEEKAIEALLAHLETLSGEKEIIVVDGGSADRTIEMIELAAERVSVAAVIEGPRGRGPQCDAGAARASGDTLLFVHADSRLEQDALARVERAVARGAAWGCFRLRFDDAHWAARAVAWASNLRARWRGVVFGDQGIFMTRELFGEVGGFPALPLMEDYQLSLNLKNGSCPPRKSIASSPVRRGDWSRAGGCGPLGRCGACGRFTAAEPTFQSYRQCIGMFGNQVPTLLKSRAGYGIIVLWENKR